MVDDLTSATAPLHAPANQSSVSYQQFSSSEGPEGTQDSGVGALLQRQSLLSLGVPLQPSREGESWFDVMQFATAQDGKPVTSISPYCVASLARLRSARAFDLTVSFCSMAIDSCTEHAREDMRIL